MDFFARMAMTQSILMVVWLALSCLVAWAAAKKGRSAGLFFIGSVFLSPILMYLILVVPGATKLVVVLVVIVIGVGIYRSYSNRPGSAEDSAAGGPPTAQEQQDIRLDLIEIANAEINCMRMNSKFRALEELRSRHNVRDWVHVNGRAGYAYSLEITGNDFVVKAKYTGPGGELPELSVNNGNVNHVTER